MNELERIIKDIESLAKTEIKVGIIDDEYVAEYATYNEYGTSKIPARSFIRSTVDQKAEWSKAIEKTYNNIIDGKVSLNDGVNKLGATARDDIKSTINSNVPPPNAPSTVARKKHSKTLIDTGLMRDSITYEVKRV